MNFSYLKKISIAALVIFLFSFVTPLTFSQAPLNQDQSSASVGSQSSSQDISRRISLELKGVDILDVLKVIAQKSGLNIVAGRDVRGQVTLYLQDVDVWDAFRTVLETSDLAYEEKDGIIKVMTERNFEQLYGHPYNDQRQGRLFRISNAKASDLANVLNQIKTSVGKIIVDDRTNSLIIFDVPSAVADMERYIGQIDAPLETRVFSMRYTKVADLEPKLTELVTQGAGSVKIDERSNKIVVTDTPSKVERIARIITAFDEQPREVLIEAKIVTVTLNDNYRFGIQYDALFHHLGMESIGISSGFPLAAISSGTIGTGAIANSLSSITLKGGDFTTLINFLNAAGKVNVLASPRVTVISGEEARFTSARRQPFVTNNLTVPSTGPTVNAANVQFVDVGVTLTVTPTITKEGMILMKVKPESSSSNSELVVGAASTGSGAGDPNTATTRVPIVETNEAESTVLIESGNVIVMGGLIDETQSKDVSKVPVLGDFPVVGVAFRSRADDFKRKELVLFLKATLVNPVEKTPEVDKYLKGEREFRDFDEVGNYSYNTALYESHGPFDNRVRPYWLIDGTEKPEWQRPVNVYREKEKKLKAERESLQPQDASNADKFSMSGEAKNNLSEPLKTYMSSLQTQILEAIHNKNIKAAKGTSATLHVVLLRDGILEKATIETQPKQADLEGALLDCIKEAAPFEDVPVSSSKKETEFIFTIHF